MTAVALIAPASAQAQDLEISRVTRGPGPTVGEGATHMVLSSADGRRAVFTSVENLLGDDGFNFYERIGETTSRMATFGGTGSRYTSPVYAASADATRIVFRSYGHWTADDTDEQQDVYTARGGVVERVSQGPTGGNQIDFDAEAVGMSGDGSRVLFESAENLTADDTDFRKNDIFLRQNGATTRVSTGPNGGNEHQDAELRAHSADASVLVLGTVESLTPDDTDGMYDLFARAGGTTTKLTPGNGLHHVDRWIDGISPDGRAVVFYTSERLTPDDTDDRGDAYRAAGGTVTRVSTGPLGGNGNFAVGVDTDSSVPRGYVIDVSDDGQRVVFYTAERLTADDADTFYDAYVWSPSGTVRVPGHPAGASADGATVVTRSDTRLTADDLDDRSDLFVTRGGVTRLVTTGNAPVDTPCRIPNQYCGGFAFISEDGSRVFFETTERLVPADTDDKHDVYQWAGGVTTLLSPERPGHGADKDVTWVDGAVDGSIVYVETEERLTADDDNTRPDAFRVQPPAPGEIQPQLGGAQQQAVSSQATPTVRLRLRARPRSLRLARGMTRLARSGRGVPFSLSRRSVVIVTIKRLRSSARPVVLRLPAAEGRHVLRLARRLPGGRRLRPGRYRITLAATNTARLTLRLSGP